MQSRRLTECCASVVLARQFIARVVVGLTDGVRCVWFHCVSWYCTCHCRANRYISVGWGGDSGGESEVQGPRVLIDYVMSTILANLNNGL